MCPWSTFGRPATPGKVHHCYKFSPFVDNGSDRSSLESQSLRNKKISKIALQSACDDIVEREQQCIGNIP